MPTAGVAFMLITVTTGGCNGCQACMSVVLKTCVERAPSIVVVSAQQQLELCKLQQGVDMLEVQMGWGRGTG